MDTATPRALVTGGSSGIGRGIAETLARDGCDVGIFYLGTPEAGQPSIRAIEAHGRRSWAKVGNVAEPDQARRAVAEFVESLGGLEILVNCAGIIRDRVIWKMSDDEWQSVIDTNLTGVFVCCQAAYPHLKASAHGKIINIGSMTSIFGASFAAPYSASKGAVVQLTRALASAWAGDNIQVNALLPGWIDTDLTRRARVEVPGLHERVEARTPAGRWGVPEDLAGTAVFLSSPASDFVTGVALPVDGGYSIQA